MTRFPQRTGTSRPNFRHRAKTKCPNSGLSNGAFKFDQPPNSVRFSSYPASRSRATALRLRLAALVGLCEVRSKKGKLPFPRHPNMEATSPAAALTQCAGGSESIGLTAQGGWYGNLENRSMRTGLIPQAPAGRLNSRAADRQPHPETVIVICSVSSSTAWPFIPISVSSALILLIFSILSHASRNLFTAKATKPITGALTSSATAGTDEDNCSNLEFDKRCSLRNQLGRRLSQH